MYGSWVHRCIGAAAAAAGCRGWAVWGFSATAAAVLLRWWPEADGRMRNADGEGADVLQCR